MSLRWPLARRSPEDLAKGAARNGVVVVFFRALAAAVAVSSLGLTGSAAAQAAPASGKQLTGTQLASALLPLSYFPADYSILWAGSSGSRLEYPAVKGQPVHLQLHAVAALYYHANYALSKRCETVTTSVAASTLKLTTQSLANGHADGYPAFFEVLTLTYSGQDEGSTINDAETVLAGRDVVSITRIEPPARTLLSPSAATLALIARVQKAQTPR
jgi:hypothetical protein